MVANWQGFLSVDKPSGWTSRRAVDAVRDLIPRSVRPEHFKIGHAGTLDPLATGVLVICLGHATRLVSAVQEYPKTYRAVFELGATSSTDDCTGDVTRLENPVVPQPAQVQAALECCTGKIWQIPPKVSAVHVEGRRAYSRARAGEEFSLAPKEVTVYRLELLRYEWPTIEVEVECSSGTYIRSIARDIGAQLQCGGLMSSLVRTAIGPWSLDRALPPEAWARQTNPVSGVTETAEMLFSPDALQQRLDPLGQAVQNWPRWDATLDQCLRFAYGQVIPAIQFEAGSSRPARWAVFTPSGQLWALVEAIDPAPDGTCYVRADAVFGRPEQLQA